MKTNTKTISGDALVLTAMALFGTYGLYLRQFPGIPILAFLMAYQLVGVVVLGYSMIGVQWSAIKRRLALFVALSLCAIGNDFTYFASLRLTSVANGALAHQSMSLFLLVFAPWLLKERTHRSEWIGLCVALLGFVILYFNGIGYSDNDDFLGITLGLVSGFFMALVIVLYRKLPGDDMPVSAVNFCRYAVGTVVLLPIFLSTTADEIEASHLLPLVGFALLFGIIGTMIHTTGISRTRSLHASILGKTEPVFAAVYALVLLDQGLSKETIVGGVLILGTSLWLAMEAPSKVA